MSSNGHTTPEQILASIRRGFSHEQVAARHRVARKVVADLAADAYGLEFTAAFPSILRRRRADFWRRSHYGDPKVKRFYRDWQVAREQIAEFVGQYEAEHGQPPTRQRIAAWAERHTKLAACPIFVESHVGD